MAAQRTKSRGKGRTPPQRRPAPPPKRPSPRLVVLGSIGAVVLVGLVVVLVLVVSGGGKTAAPNRAPAVTPASASVLQEIAAVTPAEAAAVGTPSLVARPTATKAQPLLKNADGKPQVLFIGAEFCPYCAAERWALVMALSRFGTFSNLHETTSSPFDLDPSTATFTFYGSSYSSRSVDFAPVENEGNDTTALGTRKVLQAVTSEQETLWGEYESEFGQQPGFPFLDIANQVLLVTPSYDPKVLAGLSQAEIAAKLANPHDPATEAIVGAANYLTAGICDVTGATASPWCSAAAVTAAAHTMKLP